MKTFYVISRYHFKVKWGMVETLIDYGGSWIEKHKVRTSVCDLKMSHIGEPHQLASVYIRVG